MALTAAHVVFFLGVLSLLVAMGLRKNVVIPAIAATFLTALVYTGQPGTAVMAVFRANTASAGALLELFVVIAVVTAMLASLRAIGADQRMIAPFARLMVNGRISFAVLFAVTYLLSLFFWPTPALALVGTLLLPAAMKAGLSPMGAAIAIAISGQGMAIASDYVIGLAPSISASGAGIPAQDIADRALVISVIVGAVAVAVAYVQTVRKELDAPVPVSALSPDEVLVLEQAAVEAGGRRSGAAGAGPGTGTSAAEALDEDLPGWGRRPTSPSWTGRGSRGSGRSRHRRRSSSRSPT